MQWLRRRISRARETLRTVPGHDCLELDTMRRYFELLYDVENLDARGIVDRLNPKLQSDLILPFKEIAEGFRLIADEGVGLIIPATPEIEQQVEQLREIQHLRVIMRNLQHYSVNIRNKTLGRLVRNGAVEIVRECFPVLRNSSAYHPALGLVEEIAEIWDPETLIV